MTKLAIEPVACLSDNYAYLIHSPEDGFAPWSILRSGTGAQSACRARLKLTHILNTHHHFDHTGGNLSLKEEFGAEIVGRARTVTESRHRCGCDRRCAMEMGLARGAHS